MNGQMLQAWMSNPIVIALGWTLFHFLWQALWIAGMVGIAVTLLRRRSAAARYRLALWGMAVMALAPLATAIWEFQQVRGRWGPTLEIEDASAAIAFGKSAPQDGVPATSAEEYPGPVAVEPRIDSGVQTSEVVGGESFAGISSSGFQQLERWLPLLVGSWAMGVALLSARLLGGLWRVRQLRTQGRLEPSPKLRAAFDRIQAKLGVSRPIGLFESIWAQVPTVIGWLRPVVLVPSSVVAGLTPSELESLLAHELAHIRRHDYLMNLVQTVVETLLFYHPAVWWLSRRVRELREDCCDDVAIGVCGNRLVLARALAQVESLRAPTERLALTAAGGALLQRIRRVVGQEPVPRQSWWLAGAVSLLLLCGLSLAVSGAWAGYFHNPEPQLVSAADASLDEFQEEATRRATHQPEVEKLDSRTGAKKRVLAGVKLASDPSGGGRRSLLDMAFSSVFSYTVIPARVAAELNAVELGEIDFGEKAPATALENVPLLELSPSLLRSQTDRDSHLDSTVSLPDPVFVGQDVGDRRQIEFAPHPGDSIWLPGHLAFYNMNASQQHRFKVVRIESVDLGLGPVFGPVHALVSDDINSDFGVLGRDWTRCLRGPNGETFIASAIDGFYYGRIQQQQSEAAGELQVEPPPPAIAPPPPPPATGEFTVESFPAKPAPGEPARDLVEFKLLASHSYNLNRRESAGWVEVDGVRIPVDQAVEWEGIKAYLTLMFDVVAVDAQSGKVLWKIDWGKTMPIFQTLSIGEVQRDGKPLLALRLIPSDRQGDSSSFVYRELQTGLEIHPDPAAAAERPQSGQESTPVSIRKLPPTDQGRQVAEVRALTAGRAPTELREKFADLAERGLSGWVVDMETLISAENPSSLFANSLEAEEVIFNLPEGSGMRVEFRGEQLEFQETDQGQQIRITHGRIELYDGVGVQRAWASPDGGAEQLVVTTKMQNGEAIFRLRTRRIQPSPEYPNPPVQVVMNVETGAPQDEPQPPHGAIRYELQPPRPGSNEPFRMKMKWHYDLDRLPGDSSSELAPEAQAHQRENPNEQVAPPDMKAPSAPVRDSAVDGLQLELAVGAQEIEAGQPVLCRLVLRNTGSDPIEYDPQDFAAFRVLQVTQTHSNESDWRIGLTPQTSGGDVPLPAGEKVTLWEDFDAAELYLLDTGEYDLQVIWQDRERNRRLASNRVSLKIAGGKLPAQKRVLQRLRAIAPDGWQVSQGFNGIQLMHSPTNLKRDVTAIHLTIQDEPAAPQTVRALYLGEFELGHVYLAAPPRADQLWPEHSAQIKKALAAPDNQEQAAAAAQKPWRATGTVLGPDGKPLAGVTVRAHSGMGTLFLTGETQSDVHGKYVLDFGPGIWSSNRQAVQAATISVSHPGYFERNLHRQGDLLASWEKPEGDLECGGRTVDELFLPNRPRQVDFQMMPSTEFHGRIVDEQGNPLEGLRVALTGPELPPSSSVAASTHTDKGGRFKFSDLPTGYRFQLLVEPATGKSPWLAWASPFLEFLPAEPGTNRFRMAGSVEPATVVAAEFELRIRGTGVNWRDALRQAAELAWDPQLAPPTQQTATEIRAQTVSLVVGGK